MAFLEINGIELPCPKYGMDIIISTAVNAGRNANNEVIAEKVGRDVLKYNNLEWCWVDAQECATILGVFDNFFVTAKVWNPARATFETIKMYPGDRSAQPYWIDKETKVPINYISVKVNIIDCGLL